MTNWAKLFLLITTVLVLSACQGEQKKTVKTTAEPEVKGVVPLAKEQVPNVPVVEKSVDDVKSAAEEAEDKSIDAELTVKDAAEKVLQDVDLTVSGKTLEKIDEKNEDYLTKPPTLGKEKASTGTDKIKVSGGVILNDEEEETMKMIDGGEVEVSIPIK